MQSEALKELYARRPYKAKDRDTGEVVGFDTLVDLRDALAGGFVVRLDAEVGITDPTRNYRRMTTDQVRQLCHVRNILGYLTMSHEQQIQALLDRDALDDQRNGELLKAKAAKGKDAKGKDASKDKSQS